MSSILVSGVLVSGVAVGDGVGDIPNAEAIVSRRVGVLTGVSVMTDVAVIVEATVGDGVCDGGVCVGVG